MIAFTEIVACDGTVLYQQDGPQLSFFTSGRLVLLLAYDGMLVLRLNDFEYSVNGAQTVLFDRLDPQFALVLLMRKQPSGQWILKANQNTDALYSCLQEKCHMKDKRTAPKSSPKEGPPQQPQLLLAQTQDQEPPRRASLLVEASQQVNKGLKFTGGLLSKGFESLGGFVARRVEPGEEKEVSASTKANLKLAKETTKNVLGFASEQVGNLFRFGRKVAADVGQRIEHSDKGKELQQNPHYQGVKKGVKTTVGVVANLYDGVVGAVYAAGSGLAKGASQVVGAKYGQEAGEAAEETLEGAGNVLKVMRVPADQLAKNLKE